MSRTKLSPLVKQCFVSGAVCASTVCHGCVMGYPAVLLPQLQLTTSDISVDDNHISWIASVMGMSMLVGNFVTPPVMEGWGRRAAHYGVLAPLVAGWVLTVFAGSVAELVLARVLQGLSVGMMMSLRSVLVGEYTSPAYRGALLAALSLAQAFGIFFVHAVGSLLGWRRTALVCSLFAFVGLLMTLYCPESPSWLAARGRHDECRKVFRWLRGDGEDEELEEMIRARSTAEKVKPNRRNLSDRLREATATMRKKEFYKPIVLMSHAYFMVQFAGGTTMASYSTEIIGLLMGPEASVNFWMVALDAQRIVSNAAAIYVIDKTGRRSMMFATGALCVVSHLAIAAYLYAKLSGVLPYDARWIPVVLLNLQFLSVAVGMIPLPSVIAGEVFPLDYRGIGSSISVVSLAVWLFVVLKTFPGLVGALGLHGTYALYAGILTYNLVVIWFLLPETKGRTLQQIEDEFRGSPSTPDMSLQEDSLHQYKRKVSERRCSIPLL